MFKRFVRTGRLVTTSGAYAYVKVGFSWTTLFFGPLVPLLRGDLKYFFVMLFSNVFFFPLFLWAMDYNTRYINSLLERGYYPETEALKATLIHEGFPM